MSGGIMGQSHLITTYEEFTNKLIERFDVKDPEVSFRELAQLKQHGSLDAYVNDFQQLSVMVPNISERRLVVLFMEGLLEPMRGWIKAFASPNLQEAMKKARSMEFAEPKSKSLHKEIPSTSNKTPQQSDKKKKSAPMMYEETQEELRKKKLCYWCKEPYHKDHDFPLRPKGKANHFMWAYYEDSDSDEVDQQVVSKLNQGKETFAPMTFIANVQDETTFRFRGTVDG